MGLFNSEGTWSTSCKTDPRFDMTGRANGVYGATQAIDDAVLAKQKALGLSDAEVNALTIETSFWKD